MQASPLAVMQNCDVINGRPNFRSTFMIALINSSHKFKTDLRFDITGEGDARTCVAWVIDVTDARLEGPPISIGMAKKEGWHGRKGSKWQTLPDLMLRYRSAAFFARLYAADLVLGMHTTDEAEDMESIETTATHVDQTPVVSVKPEPYQAKPTVHVDVQPPDRSKPRRRYDGAQTKLIPGQVFPGIIQAVEERSNNAKLIRIALSDETIDFYFFSRPPALKAVPEEEWPHLCPNEETGTGGARCSISFTEKRGKDGKLWRYVNELDIEGVEVPLEGGTGGGGTGTDTAEIRNV